MNQWQRMAMIVLGVLAVATPLGLAGETTVTVDVVAGQGLGESLRLVEAYPGDTIPYVITARVEDADAEAVTGLGGAVVTLECDFGAKQTPELRADDVARSLSRYVQTGLAQPGKITDIGGIQDLSRPTADVAVRERAILAVGRLVVPRGTEDGVYPIRAVPQIASVVSADGERAGMHLRPDTLASGKGFVVVVGEVQMHTLTCVAVNAEEGWVTIDPDLPAYPDGMSVTLTVTPAGEEGFVAWRHYDPNVQVDPCDPAQRDDPNVYEADPNLTVTLVMNQDRQHPGGCVRLSGGRNPRLFSLAPLGRDANPHGRASHGEA